MGIWRMGEGVRDTIYCTISVDQKIRIRAVELDGVDMMKFKKFWEVKSAIF